MSSDAKIKPSAAELKLSEKNTYHQFKLAIQANKIRELEKQIRELDKRNNQLEEDLLKAQKANPLFVIGDYFQRTTAQRRTLGTAKYRIAKFLSVDTIWLLTFGMAAGTLFIESFYQQALIRRLFVCLSFASHSFCRATFFLLKKFLTVHAERLIFGIQDS